MKASKTENDSVKKAARTLCSAHFLQLTVKPEGANEPENATAVSVEIYAAPRRAPVTVGGFHPGFRPDVDAEVGVRVAELEDGLDEGEEAGDGGRGDDHAPDDAGAGLEVAGRQAEDEHAHLDGELPG